MSAGKILVNCEKSSRVFESWMIDRYIGGHLKFNKVMCGDRIKREMTFYFYIPRG